MKIKMLKSYRYRLYPTKEQSELLDKQFGCNRLVYNLALAVKIEAWRKMKISLSAYDLIKQLPDLKMGLEWLCEVDAASLQQSILDMDKAYKSFFNGGGFPKFKKRHSKCGARFCQGIKIDFTSCVINAGKFKGIKLVIDRQFSGDISSATVTKTPTGKYFVSVLVKDAKEMPIKAPITKERSIGIDLGLSSFLTKDNGEKIDNPRFLRNGLTRLKVLQRRASRKVKGSRNRKKANLKVALCHEKITNKRLDFIHQETFRLIDDSQVDTFFMEDLNVTGMTKNHKLAQAISDVSWSKFVEVLRYKCEWSGKNLVMIDRWYPSSKTCSCCGKVKETLSLSERIFSCDHCGLVLDRDVNAARNIKHYGLTGIGRSDEPVESLTMVRAEKQEKVLNLTINK